MKPSSSLSRLGRIFLIAASIMGGVAILPAQADLVNIAPDGTAILGYNDGSDLTTLGTSYASYLPSIPDINNPSGLGLQGNAYWADTFSHGTAAYDYVGITFSSEETIPVYSLNLYMDLFNNGGWYGAAGVGSDNPVLGSSQLTDNNLEVQVQTTSGGAWTEVASGNDYVTQLTGVNVNQQFTLPPEVTFTLDSPVTDIYGIRIIGTGGSPAGTNNFIGINQLEVEAPEASTYALMLVGLGFLAILVRRKSSGLQV